MLQHQGKGGKGEMLGQLIYTPQMYLLEFLFQEFLDLE